MLRVLLTPRWALRTAFALLLIAVCGLAASWQLDRALARDSVLNWSYTVEWVLFGAFVVLVWGWYLRDELRGPVDETAELAATPQVFQPVAQQVSDAEDPELAAYNRMLQQLNEKSR